MLKKYIKESGLTLDQLSERLQEKGLSASKQYLSRLQNGKNPPASEELNKAIVEITGGDVNRLLWLAHIEKGPEITKKLASLIDEEPLFKYLDILEKNRQGKISKEEILNDPAYIDFTEAVKVALRKSEDKNFRTLIAKDHDLQKAMDNEVPLNNKIEKELRDTIETYIARIFYNLEINPDLITKFEQKITNDFPNLDINNEANIISLESKDQILLLKTLERFILENNLNKVPIVKRSNDSQIKENESLFQIYINNAVMLLNQIPITRNLDLRKNLIKGCILELFQGFELRINEVILLAFKKKGVDNKFGLDYLTGMPINGKLVGPLEKYLEFDIHKEDFFFDLWECIAIKNKIAHGIEPENLNYETARNTYEIINLALDSINNHVTRVGIE
ncbi:helix-turn-helix domain-containing protein [Bacillus mesophilum]|uniref:Helix-turn-helix transcriptional regulator n=1 Tax=Bacillus mesophilum TaxID=1071718 RepID=A0A7V7RPY0_9BACI|nr:helix-turn-helix transcriptional regulator [Bacillus mesophilum]KAB2334297.1 helix-turn-helix transcriptional regulator [Bacillus mesophilum]